MLEGNSIFRFTESYTQTIVSIVSFLFSSCYIHSHLLLLLRYVNVNYRLLTFKCSLLSTSHTHWKSIVSNVCRTSLQLNINWVEEKEKKKFMRIHLLNDLILLRVYVFNSGNRISIQCNRVTFFFSSCLTVQSIEKFLKLSLYGNISWERAE